MDLYLKFPDEATGRSVLFHPNGDRRYVNIDVIGTIYQKSTSPDEKPTPLEGWHANVRLVSVPVWDEERKKDVMTPEDPSALLPYQVQVSSPVRVWA